jgi:outer membrane protein OmpA-like peptidoglycan-associated protein
MDAQSGFSFTGDRAEFVDLPAAKEIARKIVSDITSASCVTQVTITGFVASGTSKALYSEREGDALANNRAKAFAKLLIDAGLPKAVTIKTVGGGKGPYNDWGPDGAFDEEKGKKNRFAVVTFD